MGVIAFFLMALIPVFGFLYNLVAAIYYNTKRAVSIVNADPSKADEKDGVLTGNILWASLFLSIIVIGVAYLAHG